jgi:hypothetical protein
MIDQSVWREGLADPDYERIENRVHNIIIHHSAGSNFDTNYTGIVRNIYIYHTEIRGWSDIGYNYLIAADGTIFKGRDPGVLEQDNVLGAHFCASNSGTMGICVMGTYTEISPSNEALTSLITLANWKSGKDSLDPTGNYPHNLNTSLPVIAGHRDGCATECPGEILYRLLDSIRYEVLDMFQGCGYTIKPVETVLKEIAPPGSTIFYTADFISVRFGEGRIREFKLYDMSGQEVHLHSRSFSSQEIIISLDNMRPGIYIIKILHNANLYVEKVTCF